MKNTIKVLGIIAVVAVIGFSMAACEEPDTFTTEKKEAATTGQLTITGLAAYNGKELYGLGHNSNVYLFACQKAYNEYKYKNGSLEYIIGSDTVKGTISNGQVILKVFRLSPTSRAYESYDGNDQNVSFGILDEGIKGNVTVNFTNGVGSAAFVPN